MYCLQTKFKKKHGLSGCLFFSFAHVPVGSAVSMKVLVTIGLFSLKIARLYQLSFITTGLP